jgi:hypothetical protein
MIEKQKKFEGLNCADEGGFFPNQQSSIDNNQSSDQQSSINNNQSRGPKGTTPCHPGVKNSIQRDVRHLS